MWGLIMLSVNLNTFIIVFIAGGLGALTRSCILNFISGLSNTLPYGVVAVNALATFLTVYLGLSLPVTIAFALISGFAVALGTLSALCADCIEMILKRRFVPFIIYLLLNAVFGLISAMLAIQTYALTGDIYAP